MVQLSTQANTKAATQDLFSSMGNFNSFSCTFENSTPIGQADFISTRVKICDSLLAKGCLEFERECATSFILETGISSFNKVVNEDGTATYTVLLNDGMDSDFNVYDNCIMTIQASYKQRPTYPMHDCSLTLEDIWNPWTYKSDLLLDKADVIREEQRTVYVLDLNWLGVMDESQKHHVKRFMESKCDYCPNENKTLCWIETANGGQGIGVYGLEVQNVISLW